MLPFWVEEQRQNKKKSDSVMVPVCLKVYIYIFVVFVARPSNQNSIFVFIQQDSFPFGKQNLCPLFSPQNYLHESNTKRDGSTMGNEKQPDNGRLFYQLKSNWGLNLHAIMKTIA